MLNSKGKLILASLFTICCFFTAAWVSCTKPGDGPKCNGVTCLNQGYCKQGACVCPDGYEGVNCGTASVAKYIGTWDAQQTVSGSSVPTFKGRQFNYSIFFKASATPTTFFINNFINKASYNQVIAILDSNSSFSFYLDTIRPLQMWYDQMTIRQPSGGTYNAGNRTINATFIVRYLNMTSNWQIDTLSLYLKPHNF